MFSLFSIYFNYTITIPILYYILDASTVFDEVDKKHRGCLTPHQVARALTMRFGHHLPQEVVDEAIHQQLMTTAATAVTNTISSSRNESESTSSTNSSTELRDVSETSDESKQLICKESFEKISCKLADQCKLLFPSWSNPSSVLGSNIPMNHNWDI